ncbi:hypothetical protein [Maioricimonas sp. JC845]|uniref:hypothetical protein n=1 Tax=Maioricimonas sp. JC845 TaxID=3232138 RepID=UPI003459D36D
MTEQASERVNAIRARCRTAAEQSGLSMLQIGLRMGYSEKGARQAASRLLNLNHDYDPRLSTLIAFADAVGCSLRQLVGR